MAKHLDKQDIQAVINIIHGWPDGKMTWDAICTASEPLIGKKPTRQSLNSHGAIATAYRLAKKRQKEGVQAKPRPSSLSVAAARISNLEKELEATKEENRLYKQQFIIWQYNAYKHGLTERQLNETLPKIDRERSDGGKR